MLFQLLASKLVPLTIMMCVVVFCLSQAVLKQHQVALLPPLLLFSTLQQLRNAAVLSGLQGAAFPSTPHLRTIAKARRVHILLHCTS